MVQRFFLHVHNHDGDAVDEEGQEFADLDDARRAAIVGIRSLLCSELTEGRLDLRATIEIDDDQGIRVLSVPYVEALCIIS
jgi:hypothetical protein